MSERQTEGEVEVEVTKPQQDDWELRPEGAFKTSEKTDHTAAIVITILAAIGLGILVYLQVAHATGIWPF